MNQREFEDYNYFQLVANEEQLEAYSEFIQRASEAELHDDLVTAEREYRDAITYAEKTWGAYCWMAGSALMHLTNVLDLQGRKSEADVTDALCARILAKGVDLD